MGAARIVLFGGAGLVGQNLAMMLEERGHTDIVVVDKSAANVAILKARQPRVTTLVADMAERGAWEEAVAGAASAVMLQAQIGGEDEPAFARNSVATTELALAACVRHGVRYLVHASSSVVNSVVRDWYTESKREQERMIAACPVAHAILRPTLMFGWFDRKHLGWLARFMQRVPMFPVPGAGDYLRQPLYVRDFCGVVLACLDRTTTGTYNISGREKIPYIEIVRAIKRASDAGAAIVRIPYRLFWLLLRAYAAFDRNPPFTTRQLEALVAPEEFEVIPWWDIFGVPATPFARAIDETFGRGPYRDVVLEF